MAKGAKLKGSVATPMAALARLFCAAALAVLAACGDREASAPAAAPAQAALDAPRNSYLIPRSLLFGDPQRAYGRLSPDGTTLAWLEPVDGVLNIWTAPVDEPEKAAAITNVREVGVYQFDWLYNNTHIVYVLGGGGAEQRVYSVDVITGEVRDLAPGGSETFSSVAATSWDYPDEVVVAANDRDPDYTDLYRVNVTTGDRELLFKNGDLTQVNATTGEHEPLFPGGGFTRIFLNRSLDITSASTDLPDGSRVLYTLTGDGEWRKRGDVNAEDALQTRFLGYDSTNSATLVIDSRGREYAALARFDLQTGQTSVLAAAPGVDVSNVLLHPTTFEADAVLIDGLSFEWLPLTSRAADAFSVLNQRLRDPYTVLSRTVDDRLWVVFERGATNPGVYHLFNRETGRIDKLMDVRPDLAAHRLAPMTPVLIKARDGLELVSFLTLPPGADGDGDGKPERASPLVIVPDLGPQRRTSLGYDSVHQWLADRGYAALSVSVRGATGFGKTYRSAGDGEIGAAVQDDLRDAAAWAIAQGVADPERMGVFGLWLNGHAALLEAAAADTPFACAAAYNAPADLVGLLDSAPPYWGEFGAFLRQRLGDAADPATRERLTALSPIHFAERMKLPTLMGNGDLNGGVQATLARETAERAHAAGAPTTFVALSNDAGSLLSPLNQRGYYAVLEAFFAECLGGKLQPIGEDMRAAGLEIPVGAEHVPALSAVLAQAQ